ncbi:ABC transporter permease [Cyclobacteriaceae bacterium]|nr:ABC transporter permease [Cyclobacteriaceae bacterium]
MISLLKLAWRNCWRSKGRTLVVVFSIIVGVWASLLLMGFMDGLMASRQETGVDRYYSHIQIETKTYEFDQSLVNAIPDIEKVEKALDEDPGIKVYSERFLLDASLSTARNQQGGQVIGIDSLNDKQTVGISDKLVEGSFFGDKYKRPIVIGEKLADKLKVKLGSKIWIGFVGLDTSQVKKSFKVVGIFKSGDAGFDEGTVFVPNKAISELIKKSLIHRVLVKTNDLEDLKPIQERLQAQMPNDVIVKTWRESAVVLAYGEEMYNQIMFIIMGVIIVALLFGIVNTIVMSILERKREIGVLLSIGMNKNKVRLMIALESMIYGVIGGPVGVFLGFLSIQYLAINGLDLGSYGKGMEEFGIEKIVYFSLSTDMYFIYGAAITFASFLAGLYPASIATKMNPVEAVRSI